MRKIQREFDFGETYVVLENYENQVAFVKSFIEDSEANIPFTCSSKALEARLKFLKREFEILDKLQERVARDYLNLKTYGDLCCRDKKLLKRLEDFKASARKF